MPFLMECECGKKYRVADEHKGRKVKCAACGAVMKSAEAKPASPPATPARERLSEAAWKPFPLRALAHWAAYPLLPTMLAVLAGIVLGLAAWLSPWLAPLALLPLAGLWFYFGAARKRYASVAIRPAIVVSVSPPLLAIIHSGVGSTADAVLKITRFSPAAVGQGQLQVGQRAAVLIMPSGGNLASRGDFALEYPSRLTNRPDDLAQTQAAIPAGDWRLLDFALQSLLMQDEPGLFVAPLGPPHESLPARTTLEAILSAELGHTPDQGRYLASGGIAPPVIQAAETSFAHGLAAADVLALVKCNGDASGKHALVFAVDGMRFKVNDKFASDLLWTDLWTSGLFGDELEIVYASGIRMRIPTAPFAASAPAIQKVLARVACG